MPTLHIIAREAAAHLRSARVRLVSALAIALTVLTVVVGLQDYRTRLDAFRDASVATAALRTARRGVLSTDGREDDQLRAARAPSSGSVLVQGFDGAFPAYWDFSPAGTIDGPSTPSPAQDAGIGSLDVEAIVRILLGLLAITMGVDTVAGDRSAGTLSSLLSQPVRPATVATGKLIGSILALSLCVSLLCLSVSGHLWLGGSGLALQPLLIALTSFGVVSVFYLATMTALGMIIGALSRSLSAALSLSVGLWITLTLGAPVWSAVGPQALGHQPTRSALEAALKQTQSGGLVKSEHAVGALYWGSGPGPTNETALQRRKERPPASRPDVIDAWRTDTSMLRRDLDAAEIQWKSFEARRNRWSHWLGWTSPATTFWHGASAMAGTGEGMRTDWQAGVDEYQEHLNATFFDAPHMVVISMPPPRRGTETLELRATPNTIGEVGMFVAPDDSIGRRLRDARWDLAILALYVIVFSTLAIVLFPRAGF